MTIEKIRLCEDCAEALQAAGYALERIDNFRSGTPLGKCEQCRKKTGFRAYHVSKGDGK